MDKKYTITFYASVQGSQAVIASLKQMEAQTGQLSKVTDTASKATVGWSTALGGIAKRALMTIPVWMALRPVIMGITTAISDVVTAQLDLETGLARIKTVMPGTASEVAKNMGIVKQSILDMATKTKVPLKDLLEAFYFLQTSDLSFEEARAGFEPVIKSMVGSGIENPMQMARALAGAYNTMGRTMDASLSPAEKFWKIADTLNYTFAIQDVEMNELIAGYSKFAPYMSGLSDNFAEVVTVLGFLNTHLLRSGRAGQLLGRAVIQLSQNSSQLASAFGITFDPNQPMNLLNTIKLLSDKLGSTKQLTVAQGQAIHDVFATQGQVPIRLMIEGITELGSAIERAGGNIEGFTNKINDIRMMTVASQLERMKNINATLLASFLTGATGAGDYASALDKVNDSLETMKIPLQAIGSHLGYINYLLGQSSVSWEYLFKAWVGMSAMDFGMMKNNLSNLTKVPNPKTFQEYVGMIIIAEKEREKENKLLEKTKEGMESLADFNANTNKISEMFFSAQIDMLKVMGVSEYQILLVKEQQLMTQKGIMTESTRLMEMDKLRLQQQIALKKERQADLNLVMQYEQGAIGKEELQKVFELKQMSSRGLSDAYAGYDKDIILKHLKEFSDEAVNLIAKQSAERAGIELPLMSMYKRRAERTVPGLLGQAGSELTDRGRMSYLNADMLKPSVNANFRTSIGLIEVKAILGENADTWQRDIVKEISKAFDEQKIRKQITDIANNTKTSD